MFDITSVLEAAITLVLALVTAFLVPWIKEKKNSEKLSKVIKVAEQVVYAAWELDITKELLEMGMTKAEYAWLQAKTILAEKKIAINDEELKAYIKSEVAKLRLLRGDEIEE